MFLSKIRNICVLFILHYGQPEHPLLDIIKSKQLLYLEIHDEKDGQKVFKCSTRFDWYILQNKPYQKKTKIYGQDQKTYVIDLTIWKFIPNSDFKTIKKLTIGKGKVKILHSRSSYGTDKKWMSRDKTDKKLTVGKGKVKILHSKSSYETRKKCMSREQDDEYCYTCVLA